MQAALLSIVFFPFFFFKSVVQSVLTTSAMKQTSAETKLKRQRYLTLNYNCTYLINSNRIAFLKGTLNKIKTKRNQEYHCHFHDKFTVATYLIQLNAHLAQEIIHLFWIINTEWHSIPLPGLEKKKLLAFPLAK